ncbi:MAG TPA: carboxypeptidase regulatory-like domain-containing protein, partial [Bryobacteraceae bacterium]|nr:carboxypeptidase regulatory-like domain-containing protein [Bryobacteraceae bacterium]
MHFASAFRLVRNASGCALLAGVMLGHMNGEPVRFAVQGSVLDPSRTPIAGAMVTATPQGRAAGRSTHTGQAGEFAIPLESGSYSLHIAADGFRDAVRTVVVGDSPVSPLEIVLSVAARQDMVTVTETANYQVLTSSSTRTSIPLRDVPQSISVVTQDLI